MKKDTIRQIKNLANTERKKLTAGETDFYNEKGFLKLSGRHKAVILNPTPADMAMVRQLADKIPVNVTYIKEPADDGNITRHKLLST